MSEVMLHGVLNMPIEIWGDDHLDKIQRHSRYVEASKTILAVKAQRDELLAMVYELLPYIEESDDGGYKKGVIPNLVKKINNLIAKCEQK